MNKTKNKSLWTLIIGVVCLVVAFILKDFELGFLGNLRPIGLVTIYICPILGVIGIVLALIEKSVARAISVKPDILLLDEPTSSLDPELVAGVLSTIKSWQLLE